MNILIVFNIFETSFVNMQYTKGIVARNWMIDIIVSFSRCLLFALDFFIK